MITITNKQKILLHYTLLHLDQEQVGKIFYDHVLVVMPHFRVHFKDLKLQQHRFVSFLIKIIHTLDEPEKLQVVLRELTQQHTHLSLKPAHFNKMGDALIVSLEEVLGDKYTPEIGDAWRALYHSIAEVMLSQV
ncbi:hypothetical protein G4Y79_00830 [Phototrophicus methaneseepsis]|uniref:Globin domain-containing protein n=1 Tax=Phototrophicus methaneseepsis TaxID=2710758 RepID=A0A7S8IDT0_9CHLR|nr:globin domain-containing protein [Phototrophicus methaneseepsis]QPC82950.1 hypothetical protein G4Y79_00830 [Phototrophicus methaneseepsis]